MENHIFVDGIPRRDATVGLRGPVVFLSGGGIIYSTSRQSGHPCPIEFTDQGPQWGGVYDVGQAAGLSYANSLVGCDFGETLWEREDAESLI